MNEDMIFLLEKLVFPIILAAFSSAITYYFTNKTNKQKDRKNDLTSLKNSVKNIISTLENERYSKPLLNFECNQFIGEVCEFCKKYHIEQNNINDLLIDFKMYATGDNPDPTEVSKIGSSIIARVQRSK